MTFQHTQGGAIAALIAIGGLIASFIATNAAFLQGLASIATATAAVVSIILSIKRYRAKG